MDFYTETRPWGNFKQFVKNEKATVKILTVEPNQELSLQLHNKREEFWRVISGTPIIEIDDKKIQASVGDEFFIKAKQKHRITAEDQKAEILEISFGEFDEEDEVRLEDKYGRIDS